jgi:hypothetical protein
MFAVGSVWRFSVRLSSRSFAFVHVWLRSFGPPTVRRSGLARTVLVYHATFCINSLAHVHGRQRYVTGDDSRIIGFWRSSRWARVGTATIMRIKVASGKASGGGRSILPSTS